MNEIKPEWLVEAGLRFNSMLRSYPMESNIHIAIATVTRIDVSDNSLGRLPLFLFQLPSLQQLNASKNKISHLPGMLRSRHFSSLFSSPTSGTFPVMSDDGTWNAPMLWRINLSHNRLNTLPSELFLLPVLEYLNVEYNSLSDLPFEMWMSPKLKILNLSRNMLEDLPCGLYTTGGDSQMAYQEVERRSPSPLDEDLTTAQKRDTFPLLSNQSEKTTGKLARWSEAAMKFGKAAFRMKDFSRDSTNNAVTMSTLEARLISGSLSDSSESEIPESSDSDVFLDDEPMTKGYTLVNVRRFRLCSTGSIEGDNTEEEHANMGEMNSIETLDLSHNRLNHVPAGLPCLAPKLTKLVLSHNKISDFGPMNKYPVGLMDLELSCNRIRDMSNPVNHVSVRNKSTVFRLLRSSSTYDSSVNITDVCYSPTFQYSIAQRSAQPTTQRLSRDLSGSSPTSPSHNMVQFCKHRRHRVLATLRTLDLSSNQITQLDVIARTVLGTGVSFEEEEPRTPGNNREEESKVCTISQAIICFPI